MVMHVFCVAAIKMSVESIIESHVSIFETMFPKCRTPEEKNANNSMMIRLNGPNLAHCIPVVKNALVRYSEKHKTFFTVQRESIKSSFQVSKVLHRKKHELSKLPFMED